MCCIAIYMVFLYINYNMTKCKTRKEEIEISGDKPGGKRNQGHFKDV